MDLGAAENCLGTLPLFKAFFGRIAPGNLLEGRGFDSRQSRLPLAPHGAHGQRQ